MENWLEIGVAIFLAGMVLYGHYKGFIRLAVSMAALIVSLIFVNAAMPGVSVWLKENTPILHWIEQGMSKVSDYGIEEGMPFEQRQTIERLNLPQEMKDILIENNNNEVYETLGVQMFNEYVGNYLANITFHLIGFWLLFIAVYLTLRLLMKWLDLMAKLPILSGINKIAGAALGGIQGLLLLWMSCLVVAAFSGTIWAGIVMRQIEASGWLSFLYYNNVISKLVFGVIRSILS